MREAQILGRLKITYYREPVVDVGRVDEGEILFSLDRDRVLAVKNQPGIRLAVSACQIAMSP